MSQDEGGDLRQDAAAPPAMDDGGWSRLCALPLGRGGRVLRGPLQHRGGSDDIVWGLSPIRRRPPILGDVLRAECPDDPSGGRCLAAARGGVCAPPPRADLAGWTRTGGPMATASIPAHGHGQVLHRGAGTSNPDHGMAQRRRGNNLIIHHLCALMSLHRPIYIAPHRPEEQPKTKA